MDYILPRFWLYGLLIYGFSLIWIILAGTNVVHISGTECTCSNIPPVSWHLLFCPHPEVCRKLDGICTLPSKLCLIWVNAASQWGKVLTCPLFKGYYIRVKVAIQVLIYHADNTPYPSTAYKPSLQMDYVNAPPLQEKGL